MPVLQCPMGEAGPKRGPGVWKMTPAVLDYPVIVKELDEIACSVDLSGRMAPLDAWLEIKSRMKNQLRVRTEAHRKSTGRRRKRLMAKRSRVVMMKSSLERTRELEQCDPRAGCPGGVGVVPVRIDRDEQRAYSRGKA